MSSRFPQGAAVAAAFAAALGVMGVAPVAQAFDGGEHETLSFAACEAAGLPSAFCRRVGVESLNTDANEWDDPIAHAQIPDGMATCTAANQVVARLQKLGQEFRTNIEALGAATTLSARDKYAGQAAEALGRAMHTVQDDFAHEGMGNPEHAWFSLEDFCTGSELAPDSSEAAYARAQVASAEIMVSFAASLNSQAWHQVLSDHSCPEPYGADTNQRGPCDQRLSPWLGDVCTFLADSKEWNGIDRRWKIDQVAPVVRDALLYGTGADLCTVPELDAPPAPVTDVSGGIPTCGKAHIACFGKVDDVGDGDGAGDAELADPNAEGGCSVGSHQAPSSHWLLVAMAMGGAAAVRRRRRPSRGRSAAPAR